MMCGIMGDICNYEGVQRERSAYRRPSLHAPCSAAQMFTWDPDITGAHLQPEAEEPVLYLHEEHPPPANRCLPDPVVTLLSGGSVAPMISCCRF